MTVVEIVLAFLLTEPFGPVQFEVTPDGEDHAIVALNTFNEGVVLRMDKDLNAVFIDGMIIDCKKEREIRYEL